jgi:methionyl-tRNA formyltransferase
VLNKRIIFMGTPKIAASYLQSLIDLQYNLVAVFSQPPRKKGRGLLTHQSDVHKLALSSDIKIFTPINLNSEQITTDFNNLKPDFVYISHLHCDHLDPKTLLGLKNKNMGIGWLLYYTSIVTEHLIGAKK